MARQQAVGGRGGRGGRGAPVGRAAGGRAAGQRVSAGRGQGQRRGPPAAQQTAGVRNARQAAGRVAANAQDFQPDAGTGQAAGVAPTIAQVAVAQGQNMGMLRTLLEDLANGVLELSKVVGTHTRALADTQLRIEAIEHELGVEIDAGAGDEGEATPEDEFDGDAPGDYDDHDEQLDEHAEEAA
jgi:hypothetical protein